MGGCLVGHVFGLHHRVAELSAERYGLRVQEGVVRNEGEEDREKGPPENGVAEGLAGFGVVQVEPGIRQGFIDAELPPADALPPHAVQEDDDAKGEEGREDHVGKDPDVGAGRLEAEHQKKGEENEKNADDRHVGAEEADGVAVQSAPPVLLCHACLPALRHVSGHRFEIGTPDPLPGVS